MAASEQFSATVKLDLVHCDTVAHFNETVEIPGLNGLNSAKIALDKDHGGSVLVKPGPVEEPKFLVLRPLTALVRDPAKPDDPGVEKDIDAHRIPRDDLAKNLTFNKGAAPTWGLGRTQLYYEALLPLLLGRDPTVKLDFKFAPFLFTPGTPPNAPQLEVVAVTVQVFGAYRSQPQDAPPPGQQPEPAPVPTRAPRPNE